MAKVKLLPEQIELLQETEEGQAYLEYNDKVGGEPIGFTVPFGLPDGVEELGGIVAVYKKCVQENKTWEELLKYQEPPDDVII